MVSSFGARSLSILVGVRGINGFFMYKRKYFGTQIPQQAIPEKSWSPFERLYATAWLVSLLK